MPPYLPLLSLNRSQSTRIGRGPGNTVPAEFNMGDTAINPDSGALYCLLYADLGQGNVRRDIQRHDAVGGIETVGSASLTTYSDLFRVQGLGVTNGTGYALNVAAGQIQSRFYGTQMPVAAQTVTPVTPPPLGGRMDYVVVNNMGVVSVIQGAADVAVPTYEAWSVAIGGTAPTGGTFVIQFTYNGFVFTTPTIAFNATGAALATGILGATGGPGNSTFQQFAGAGAVGSVVGGGTALPGGPATATFAVAAEGPVVPIFGNPTGLTGGANNTVNITRTTQGVGAQSVFPSGTNLVLMNVYVPSTATSNANYTTNSTNVVLTA